jgi:hypothetical protein
MRTLRRHTPSPALVVSTIALIAALGGTSYAAFTLPKNSVGTKQLKSNAVTTKKIKNGAVTGSKLNLGGVTVPNAAHASTAATADNGAEGYARIKSDGTLDAANSKNVSAANVTHAGTGETCFHGLPFTIHNVQATLDYDTVLNGQIAQVTAEVPGTSFCSPAAQAMIFTGLVNPSVFTSGHDYGFYVVFH